MVVGLGVGLGFEQISLRVMQKKEERGSFIRMRKYRFMKTCKRKNISFWLSSGK